MFYTLKPKINLHFQKALFLIYLLVPIIPLCALQIAKTTGNVNQYGWWLLSVCILFLGIDQLFGKAWDTPTCNRVKHPKKKFLHLFFTVSVFAGHNAAFLLRSPFLLQHK